MSVYQGEYHKTFKELSDSVKNLLEYYEGRLIILNKKKEAGHDDIRVHNMRNSAYNNCRNTVSMLNTLDNDLRNPVQIVYLKKKREERISIPSKPVSHRKSPSQVKLF